MKKFKLKITISLITIYALFNFIGIPIPIKYGLLNPSFTKGVILLVIAIILALYIYFFLKEPKIYYCKKCNKIVNEDETINSRCKHCNCSLVEYK